MKKCGEFKITHYCNINLTASLICSWDITSIPLVVEEGYLFVDFKDKNVIINVKNG